MENAGIAVLAVLAVAAAGYAHYRLSFHTASVTQLWVGRWVLLAIGIGFGWVVSTTYYPATGVARVLVFLSSFGVVHVPAAVILFIKRQRKEWR